jgi:hypothetical protein
VPRETCVDILVRQIDDSLVVNAGENHNTSGIVHIQMRNP